MSSFQSASSNTSSRSNLIRATGHEFVLAFVNGSSPAELLENYFTKSGPSITEHGSVSARVRLPYLGKTFRGRKVSEGAPSDESTCDDYFDLLGATLAFHSLDKALPPPEAYIVDAESKHIPGRLVAGHTRAAEPQGSGALLVKAHVKIEALKSKVVWEEDFVFLLSEFDQDGKIGHLEIWSDNLSAWLAVGE
ncbi:hypothetical protein PVAG01_07467 [Phlyctema vagabunda]|uniref:Uncharacterized protein n=1 Tax=Phlyctema vagabunda TaxID=108571 RepID=A0ABR4PCI5_9HELO